jgi:hypothetical protein
MDSSNPRTTALALCLGLLLVAGCAHAGPAARPPAAPAGALDPSEEITPEELARIPEPLPRGVSPPSAAVPRTASSSKGDSVATSGAPGKAPAGALEPRSQSPGGDATAPLAKATPTGEWTWRVQILATPDRVLAGRVAGEAAERLGTTFRIDLESGLYKVRLGGFPGEADAQVLRQRAAEMGYPGAFRVKIRTATPDE